MGYLWPDPTIWKKREIPPNVVALDPMGYASKYAVATQYQLEDCERIAAAYGERARHRDEAGTVLTGGAGLLGGIGVVFVGASQAVEANSSAREPMLWTGVSAGVLGASLALWQTFSGTTQASAYNDAATHVRASVSDFLANVRSHDNVAGALLSTNILTERLCALREECHRTEFGVAPLGTPFGGNDKANEDARGYFDELCDPSRGVVSRDQPHDASDAGPAGGSVAH